MATFFAPEARGDIILNWVNFRLKMSQNWEKCTFSGVMLPRVQLFEFCMICSRHRNTHESKILIIYYVKTDFHAARHFLVFLPGVPISVEFMLKRGYIELCVV